MYTRMEWWVVCVGEDDDHMCWWDGNEMNNRIRNMYKFCVFFWKKKSCQMLWNTKYYKIHIQAKYYIQFNVLCEWVSECVWDGIGDFRFDIFRSQKCTVYLFFSWAGSSKRQIDWITIGSLYSSVGFYLILFSQFDDFELRYGELFFCLLNLR